MSYYGRCGEGRLDDRAVRERGADIPRRGLLAAAAAAGPEMASAEGVDRRGRADGPPRASLPLDQVRPGREHRATPAGGRDRHRPRPVPGPVKGSPGRRAPGRMGRTGELS